MGKPEVKVVVTRNGPYLVTGGAPLNEQIIFAGSNGDSEAWQQGASFPPQASYALCRCGQSKTKPYCDGTHTKVGFDGTETASRKPYAEQAQLMQGPVHSLSDAETLCAFARFCDPNGQVWEQVERTDEPKVARSFLRQVNACPSGRLVASDRDTGEPLEDALPVSIGVVQDPAQDASGPLWLRGGIPLIAGDGFAYEVRNRVTLCRCGASKNKPFCDGSHASVKFHDWA
jgi:CDGSH-type Zn-finger protein